MRMHLVHVNALVDIVNVDLRVGCGAANQRIVRARYELDREDVIVMLGLDGMYQALFKRIPDFDFQIVRARSEQIARTAPFKTVNAAGVPF